MSNKKSTYKEINERILTIVEKYEKGNVKAFSQKIGLKNQTVSNYLKGREPKISFITAICEVYDVNPNWLMMGNTQKEITINKQDIVSLIQEWLNELTKKEPNRQFWFEHQFEDAFPAFKKWKELQEAEKAREGPDSLFSGCRKKVA